MSRTGLKTSMAGLIFLALAGCGQTTGDRALSGAGLGAAGGALGGAAFGAPATGALIGGAIGGAAGAFTDPDDINLGEPIWR